MRKQLLPAAMVGLFLGIQSPVGLASETQDGGSEAYVEQITIEKNMSKKAALSVLDEILSPFEDMAEYALDKDLSGMKKGYKKIENIQDNGLLKQTMPLPTLAILNEKIERLETLINQSDFSQVALMSSQMFGESIVNFKYSKKITNQLHIEHLDKMGFLLLSMLEANKTDSKMMLEIVEQAEKHWLVIRGQLKDENKVESFNYLFQGLKHSIKHNDLKMVKILAFMDLALVDIIEKDFQ